MITQLLGIDSDYIIIALVAVTLILLILYIVNIVQMAQLKKRYRFGLGYRIAGSVNILLGLEIVNGLQLGYTYELPANALIKESFGSHELYLAYGFDILKPKNTNKYKSVRYL